MRHKTLRWPLRWMLPYRPTLNFMLLNCNSVERKKYIPVSFSFFSRMIIVCLYPTIMWIYMQRMSYIQLCQFGPYPQTNLNCTHYLFSSSSMKNIFPKNDTGVDDLKLIWQISSLFVPSDKSTISWPSGNHTEKG